VYPPEISNNVKAVAAAATGERQRRHELVDPSFGAHRIILHLNHTTHGASYRVHG
jgi:hypothetical protein